MESLLDVHMGNAEVTTTARALAIEDVRNALSFCVMNCCCVPLTTPQLIINVDATQFTVGDRKAEPTKVVYTGKRPKQLKAEPTKGQSGLTAYFIKYYATINAAGDQARSVYIIADDNMLPGEIDVREVTGLGAGASSKEISYLIFCKTRVPTIEFYKWSNLAASFGAEIPQSRVCRTNHNFCSAVTLSGPMTVLSSPQG
ncbi:hypothetical protein B484DRAFT_439069, partial [Ochromonadaceae sp. CCMP2298]